jgi:hypothetical protein
MLDTNQNNQYTASPSSGYKTTEVQHQQYNIDSPDYTGVFSICLVVLIIAFVLICCINFWIYKFFEYKKDFDRKIKIKEVELYTQVSIKLDKLIRAQQELVEKLKDEL